MTLRIRPPKNKFSLPWLLITIVALTCWGVTPPAMAEDFPDDATRARYDQLSNQAVMAIQQNRIDQAIELLKALLAISPPEYATAHANNLAVMYIKKGLTAGQARQHAQALRFYRLGYYYLEPGWPVGIQRSTLGANNTKVVLGNIAIAMKALGKADDAATHLAEAKRLRGSATAPDQFREAIASYHLALRKDATLAEALTGQIALFQLLKQPEHAASLVGQLNKLPQDKQPQDVDALLILANSLRQQGNLKEAVSLYNKILAVSANQPQAMAALAAIWEETIRNRPDHALAYANLAVIQQKRKQYAEAERNYQKAYTLLLQQEALPGNPYNVRLGEVKDVLLNTGSLYQEMKRYDVAEQAYMAVLQKAPKDVDTRWYLVRLYEEQGALDKEMGLLIGMLADGNNVPPVSRESQGYEDAWEKYRDLVKRANPQTHRVSLLERAVNTAPDWQTLQYQSAVLFHEWGDLPRAEAAYRRVLALSPQDPKASANLATIYLSQNKPDEAAQLLNAALRKDPNNTALLGLKRRITTERSLGRSQEAFGLLSAGKPRDAILAFQRLIGDDPNQWRPHYGLGLAYLQAEQPADAIAPLQRATQLAKTATDKNLEDKPSNEDLGGLYTALGSAYQQQENWVKARDGYAQALRYDPALKEAREALDGIQQALYAKTQERILSAYSASKFQDALTLTNSALQQYPGDATLLYYQGLNLYALKRTAEASNSLRQAVTKDPAQTEAWYTLGITLDELKKPADAKAAFTQFLNRVRQKPAADWSDLEKQAVPYVEARLKQ